MKNIFYFMCIFVIFLTPLGNLIKKEININNCSGSVLKTETTSNPSFPVNPISSNKSSTGRETESENETKDEFKEKMEKEVVNWSYEETHSNVYKLSYDLKLLDHIQKYTSDGFTSKLFKPPSISKVYLS